MLSEIEQIRTPQDLARAFAQSARTGGGPFGFWIDADAKAPDSYAVHSYQAGLACRIGTTTPSSDPNSQALLHKYEQHIAAMLTRFGETDAQARRERIPAPRPGLAQIQWTNVAPCETEREELQQGR